MTECVSDSLNPEFVTPIEADFFFEENHQFLIEVYDADNMQNLNNLAAQDFVGSVQFTLQKLVTSES